MICLHGGPGSGSGAYLRRFFDPARYRIIVYDQRGAGRSEPRGGLDSNTTHHLIGDLESIRRHLKVDRWLLFGGSWGATLALCYAQTHAHRVLGLILRGPLLGRQRDLDWFFGTEGVARLFPLEYQHFLSVLPQQGRTQPLAAYRQLFAGSLQERQRAARAWAAWDNTIATGNPKVEKEAPIERYAIACHYAAERFFLPENGILEQKGKLFELPATVIQGRNDLVCPPEGAATLVQDWPRAELRLTAGAGHLATDPAIAAELVAATRNFVEASRL